MIGTRKAAAWTAARVFAGTGAIASALLVAGSQGAAAQAAPSVYAPYGRPGFVGAPYGLEPAPLIVRRTYAYGAEHRWPYRPDLVVRIGTAGGRCALSYEQALTPDGLVWRPLVGCDDRD